ncbi:hypothetical protein N7466_005418 [Penicillium verhagenii]|uniref:uncharacterized protein n=1 Tax=Penicillium verhagenii TaxID=1562060 RepID=UPI002545AB72|nr:uncharacterized protein N7466_005418 [Penicillium verhagenii]KAJ5929925.1 hypothetical protein N7466_005418 [Penicillium verhagenii]
MSALDSDGISVTYSSSGTPDHPDLRLIHYNDVYHIEPGSAEPIGGVARFQSLVDYYRHDQKYIGFPNLMTFFSGDAFNPSLESSVTKGRHMVPFLNNIGTDVACLGNHDLDFGVAQLRYLASQCHFPWLLANVLDPSLGDGVPIANCGTTCMLTSSNGIKVGVIGLGEREWLGTINSLPPNLIYKSATQTAKELAPQLREQGAEIIVIVSHQREPNDNKLATNLPTGLVDIILGGHDHYYSHAVINGTHVLRSGTDFKQLSYIEAFRKPNGAPGWDFNITRRDIVRSIPEAPEALVMVDSLNSTLKWKLEKPVGYTVTPLDARFSTVRQHESNLGNFVCDLMRSYHAADCAMMAGGTIRGDQIYPPGVIRLKDLLNCFPFEDPVVLLRVRGQALIDALENGVSTLPALEGRFTQVSNICFGFKLSGPPGSRVTYARIGGQPIDPDRHYTLATRGYMARGKDGFSSLLVQSENGEAEELVCEEEGVLISTILRQYFLSLKVLNKWTRWSASLNQHWKSVHRELHREGWLKPPSAAASPVSEKAPSHRWERRPVLSRTGREAYYYGRFPEEVEQHSVASAGSRASSDAMDSDSDEDPDILPSPVTNYVTLRASSSADEERRLRLARWVIGRWTRRAGVHSLLSEDDADAPAWTSGISPKIEGRIIEYP